jgi:glycosyltransferase involved in cell wall biosynthesis
MRILLTVPHAVPTASPYREMMAIAKHLPRDEFALTVCALRPAGMPEASAVLERFGVKTCVAAFRPTAPTLQGLTGGLRGQYQLGSGRFDLQHSLDFTSSPFEVLCARAQRQRYVFTQRNLNEDGHPRLLRLKCRLATAIIAISTVTESLVRDMAPSRTPITKIPLGFDFDDLAGLPPWTPSRDTPIVLAVGHLQRRKRLEDAIRALALVRQRVANAQLWVVGRPYDKGYQRELVALADEMGLSGAVQMLGVRSDVLSLMSQASALLHCADSEAIGRSLLEAMAVGPPVVSYRNGGSADLIEHGVTGFVAEVGDYTACGQHLCRILEDDALAQRVSRAANAKARGNFTSKTFADRHASFYRTIGPTPSPGRTSWADVKAPAVR